MSVLIHGSASTRCKDKYGYAHLQYAKLTNILTDGRMDGRIDTIQAISRMHDTNATPTIIFQNGHDLPTVDETSVRPCNGAGMGFRLDGLLVGLRWAVVQGWTIERG